MLNTLLRYEWIFWTVACIATVFVNPAVFPFFIALPLFAILRAVAGRSIFPNQQFIIPICGLLTMVIVSAAVTPDLAFSLRKIAGLINGIGLFVAIIFAAKEWPNLPTWLLLAFGIVVAGAGAIGADIYARIPLLFPLFRFFYLFVPLLPAVGRVLNPNLIAGALLLTLLPSIGLLVFSIQHKRPGHIIISTISIAAQTFILLIMQSRGAILATGLSLSAFIFMLWPNRRSAIRRTVALISLVALLLALPIWPRAVRDQLQAVYFSTLVKGDEGEHGLDSLTTRQEIWRRGVKQIEGRLITGQGMNIFRTVANEPTPILPSGNEIPHAHNWALQITLELGLPGLLFYIWLLILAAANIGRSWLNQPDKRTKIAGVAAALIAFMLFGLLDTISPGARPDFIFWILMASACTI